jgi:hypothetical protein
MFAESDERFSREQKMKLTDMDFQGFHKMLEYFTGR